MGAIDLHIHSLHSDDGEFAPAELVSLAANAGVETMALSDHDSALGVAEAVRAGGEHGVRVIPAIEISSRAGNVNLHILGYFINPEHPGFAAQAEFMNDQRRSLSRTRLELLKKLGIVVDDDIVWSHARDGIVTPETTVDLAMRDARNDSLELLKPYRPGGARSDNPYVNFYWDYCGPGKPANVPMELISQTAAVDLIRDSGGIAVFAHPGIILNGREELFESICANGISGVEVFCSYHDEAARSHWLEKTQRLGLVPTCGSDFHGRTKPSVSLGGHGGDAFERAALEGLEKARDRR